MNKKSVTLIILFSAMSMVGIIWLQTRWILKGAELKDEQFNNHVEIALLWTSEQLEQVLEKEGVSAETDSLTFQQTMQPKLDSLLTVAFVWFNLKHLAHEVEVIPNTNPYMTFSTLENVYRCAAGKQLRDRGLEFRVTFLEKDRWIRDQLTFLLVLSAVLIVFMVGCFILTLRTLWQQKKMFETTSEFISNMTHEFKTPITNVAFATNLLNKLPGVPAMPRATKLTRIIKEENEKLRHHVEQILNVARLEKGEVSMNKVVFNIHEAIDESIRTMALQVHARRGNIRTNFQASKHLVKADKIHVANAITNLIDNANKYSPAAPEILIATYNTDNGVVVAVQDKGIGLSKETQKMVFKKFYRAPTGNLHNVKGFGLGLSYAKMVADSHGGLIRMNSEEGKGSCFEIFLPLNQTI